ncbi:MAG: pyridoxal-phosphate dependent enzyme [Myxococcota bacterium]
MVFHDRPLFDAFPALRVPWTDLGEFPTPLHSLAPVARALNSPTEAWVKRDDLSSPVYGGNKVRTLEVLFGQALDEGATHIVATGAFGTNHGTATVLHAPRVGLIPETLIFPQPPSRSALENLQVLRQAAHHPLFHWSQLPFGMLHNRVRARRRRQFVMVPGGATPQGALGYISAGLELAHQVAAKEMPAPTTLFVGVGSTCTTAGLLVGVRIAARLGIGWTHPPTICAVRVTPWPVTSKTLIVRLARRASTLLAKESGDARAAIDAHELAEGLRVDGTQLGKGYGIPTAAGREAIRLFGEIQEGRRLTLDTTYSAKAAAAVVDAIRDRHAGPLLFWSTKSTAPLPEGPPEEAERWLLRRWSRRALLRRP